MNAVNTKIYIIRTIAPIALLCLSALHGQSAASKTELTEKNASWTSVISGKAVCRPQNTSYGFAVLTDGKMISACTERGAKLWERAVPGTPEPYMAVISSDFIATVSSRRTLSLINPSGLPLWSVKAAFDIDSAPKAGRDGRIFIRGKAGVACYGINGICKWQLETPPLGSIPLQELDDGSIVAILADAKDGRSAGLRISPFGEVIESLTFAGSVEGAASCTDGLLLLFSGGGIGLCAVRGDKATTVWAIPAASAVFSGTSAHGGRFVNVNGESAFACLGEGGSTKLVLFKTADGAVTAEFRAEGIRCDSLVCAEPGAGFNGIFLADAQTAALYSSNGRLLWSALLPGRNARGGWNHLAYTKGNHLLVCGTSWVMNAYRTVQHVSAGGFGAERQNAQRRSGAGAFGYGSFYDIDAGRFVEARGGGFRELLKSGSAGADERAAASALLSLCMAYRNEQQRRPSGARADRQPAFTDGSLSLREALASLPALGTSDVPHILAQLIPDEPDSAVLSALFKAASECGYDPDGALLGAIYRKALSIPARNTAALISACDAVHAICRFMGRSAFYSHGMDILTNFLNPQYDSAVRTYARGTLSKIAALKL